MDLGMDVAPEAFVQAVKDNRPDIVAMSALLTTTMPQMKTTIDALREAGYRDGVRIIVGGAPVTEAYAREIGADGYAKDASQAVTLVKRLLGPDLNHRASADLARPRQQALAKTGTAHLGGLSRPVQVTNVHLVRSSSSRLVRRTHLCQNSCYSAIM